MSSTARRSRTASGKPAAHVTKNRQAVGSGRPTVPMCSFPMFGGAEPAVERECQAEHCLRRLQEAWD